MCVLTLKAIAYSAAVNILESSSAHMQVSIVKVCT